MAIGVVLISAPVRAQQSRAEEIAQREAEKAKQVTPAQPPRAETIISQFQGKLLETPGGFFPFFGSVYPSGGFTLGAGYRRLYGDRAMWDIKGLYSIKSYKLIETSTRSPGHLDGRLSFGANLGWRDATQAPYYGLGMTTVPEDRASFRFKEWYGGGDAELNPVDWVRLIGLLQFEDYRLEPGLGSFPPIETVYTPVTAPGLGESPAYAHTAGTAAIDWRTSPGYSRTGGYYGATYHDYANTDGDLDFQQLDAEVIQHIPILRETWVISLRGRMQSIVDDADTVPYFLLPSLGGGSSLRGYPSWRFRDRHSILLSGEWRWIPSRLGLDMAIFYDMGKVTARRSDLDLDGLKSNWGFGARFHGPAATPLRIELARGSEGFQIVFSGNAAF